MKEMSEVAVITLKNAITDQDHVAGPPGAAVTLLEYGNFECIDCGRIFPVLKQLRTILGENLRFAFRNFPTARTHPHAIRAAEATEAAAAQGKFWEMHDELFTHQTALEDNHLVNYARRIRLDVDRFSQDLSNHTFLKQIEADYQRSVFDEHITGTPTIYINSVRYTGSTDVQSMLVAIKDSDPLGRIQLPANTGRFRGLLNRLQGHASQT